MSPRPPQGPTSKGPSSKGPSSKGQAPGNQASKEQAPARPTGARRRSADKASAQAGAQSGAQASAQAGAQANGSPPAGGDKRTESKSTQFTREILNFLAHAHGKTKTDAKGDYFYDGVTAISLHLLLKAQLPAKDLLWAWYQYFDQQRAESIYQSLTPAQDAVLLSILSACAFPWDAAAVRASGLVFLPEHRQLAFELVEDFMMQRIEAFRGKPDAELREFLTPVGTWTDRHLDRLIRGLQTHPFTPAERQAIYAEFDSGYLRATARQMLERLQHDVFWKQPPHELDAVEMRLMALARELMQQSRRLGVYVSREEAEARRTQEAYASQGRAKPGARGGGRAHSYDFGKGGKGSKTEMAQFAVLGLKTSATLAQVKTAYREQVKRHHPDQGGTVKDFLRLQEAYEYLLTHVFAQKQPPAAKTPQS